MSNSHGVPDTMYEMQGLSKDLLPACIVSTTFPAVPAPPSLTLAAFGTKGYVIDGSTLVYVDQEAHTVTLTGADGNYWLALTQDTFTTYASYTRVAGTHYAWRANATEPASVDGLLVFCQLTVAGGAITVVTPLTKVTSQPMSKQNSNAVAITGGTATFTTFVTGNAGFYAPQNTANDTYALFSDRMAGGAGRFCLNLVGTAPNHLAGNVGIRTLPTNNVALSVVFDKAATMYGMNLWQSTDTGAAAAVVFSNAAAAQIGSITTTASATAYNTSSDGRLKERLTPLTGALATLRQLLPVRFRWKADGSPGVGFVAQDVAPVVPEAVTGSPEAPEPMGMDLSKLVPYLVAALQDLSQRLEALETRQA